MPQSPNADAFTAELIDSGVTSVPGVVITDTSNGILIGTDPVPKAAVETKPTSAPRFTEDDLARVRQQEKDKLYGELESMRETVTRLEKVRLDQEAAEEAARRAAEDEARLKAESELDLRDLLQQKQQEWEQKLEEERKQREAAFDLLQKEREYQSLVEYRQERLAEEADIMPELVDLVSGNSQEEIEAAIASVKERSARIFDSAQTAMQSARRDMVGARITAPSTGPLDTQSDNQQFTPENIRHMSMNDYAKNRDRLIRNTTARGIFG